MWRIGDNLLVEYLCNQGSRSSREGTCNYRDVGNCDYLQVETSVVINSTIKEPAVSETACDNELRSEEKAGLLVA